MPVGTNVLSNGFKERGASRLALISMPDEPVVAYAGNGLEELLIIFISIVFIRANIKIQEMDIRQGVKGISERSWNLRGLCALNTNNKTETSQPIIFASPFPGFLYEDYAERFSSSTTACATMPSSRPTKPIFSVVVALIEISFTSMPAILAMTSRIRVV